MVDSEASEHPLSVEEKAVRSGSFGSAAADYDRYRPGPSVEAVEWILGGRSGTVVDLGAGTGGLSRVLLGRVDRVVAGTGSTCRSPWPKWPGCCDPAGCWVRCGSVQIRLDR